MEISDYILSKVILTDSCWIWQGSITNGGYGISSTKYSKSFLAHRLSYEVFIGKIPSGLVIDHLCEVKSCVNPFHLEPVTSGENARRGHINRFGTHKRCTKGHEWNNRNLLIMFNGRRACRECHRIYVAKQRLLKKGG